MSEAGALKATPVPIDWHSALPVYASQQFLATEADTFGWIGGVTDGRDVRCVLPYTVLRKAGFTLVRFRTATIPVAGELEVSAEKAFLNSVVQHFRQAGADIIIPSGNSAIFRAYPDGASAAPYGTFVKDLTEAEDALLSAIRKTYRQNIRKAISSGVTVTSGNADLPAIYTLIADTMKRSGATFRSYADFERTVSALGEHVRVFTAEQDGVIQGCMVAPFSEHTAYNCYAGSKAQPVLGSMHLLHWEAIRQFRAMGVKRFDFQGVRINPEKGSKQEGILTYKQGFGGALIQGYLWKYALRRVRSIAYTLAVRLKSGGDIVDQEHHKLVTAV